MRVPDYLLVHFFRKKLGTGCARMVDSFYSLSYNAYMLKLYDLFGQDTEIYNGNTEPVTALNWL